MVRSDNSSRCSRSSRAVRFAIASVVCSPPTSPFTSWFGWGFPGRLLLELATERTIGSHDLSRLRIRALGFFIYPVGVKTQHFDFDSQHPCQLPEHGVRGRALMTELDVVQVSVAHWDAIVLYNPWRYRLEG